MIYGVIFVVCLVYTILSSPMLLLGLAAMLSMWFYSFVLISPDTPLVACGFELKRREKLVVLVPLSLLVVTVGAARVESRSQTESRHWHPGARQ